MPKVNLINLKARPHPSAAIFKFYKIPVSSVAIALDMSYSHISSILSGIRKPTATVDLRLKELASELQEGCNDEK